MNTKRKLALGAVLTMAAMQALAAAPAVLDQVPVDAEVVVVVPSLKGLSTQITNLAKRLDATDVPADPIQDMTRQLGVGKGIDLTSSAAIVILPAPANEAKAPIESRALILLPTTDAKVMLEQYKPKADAEGIMSLTLPNATEEHGFALQAGKFVVFGESVDAIKAYQAHKAGLGAKLPATTTDAMAANEIAVWTNIAGSAKEIQDGLAQGRKTFDGLFAMAGLGMGGGGMGPHQQAQTKMVVGAMFDALDQAATDADTAMLTVHLTDPGIQLQLTSQFKPGTATGKLLAAQKGKVTLEGLPEGAPIWAGTMLWNPESLATLYTKYTDRMLDDADLVPADKVTVAKKFVDDEKLLMGMINGMRFAAYENKVKGQGPVRQVGLMDVKDSKAFQALLTQMLTDDLAGIQVLQPDIKYDMTVKPDALTVKGVSLMKIAAKISAGDPKAAASVQILQKQYGKEGLVAYVGAITPTQVLFVQGGDPAALETAVAAAQAKGTALATSPEVAAAAKQTVPDAGQVMYVWAQRAAGMVKKMVGPQDQPEEPKPAGLVMGAEPAPLVLSCGQGGSSISFGMFLPTAAIKDMGNFMEQLGPMMMEGGGMGVEEKGAEVAPNAPGIEK